MSIESVYAGNGRLLTVKECMASLRIGRNKLYDLINAGKLDVVKFGQRSTRVTRESIEKLINCGLA